MPNLARRIYLARTTHEFTHAELAQRTGGAITAARLAEVEADPEADIEVHQLALLADALDVRPHDLSPVLERFYLE